MGTGWRPLLRRTSPKESQCMAYPLGGSAEGGDDRPWRQESFGVASQVEGRVGVPLSEDDLYRPHFGTVDVIVTSFISPSLSYSTRSIANARLPS